MTNPGIKRLDNYISKYDKFIISTHESPDADGLGSEIAFNDLLLNLEKTTIIINSDPIPATLEFIDIDNEINIITDSFELPDDIEDYALFVLDTHDIDNIGSAYYLLKDKVKDIFIIDHHEGGTDKLESNLIEPNISSACEIIYKAIMFYKKPLSSKSAQAIYTGILFDTHFRFPKTSPETYRIAAHCIEVGADPFKIYENIYENNSLSSFELRGLILSTMEVFYDGKLIIMKLTPEMLEKSSAFFSEGEPAINLPLTVKGVVASALVKQDFDGPVKVSMRTKGDLNVAEIAIKKGGGGHKNAAGYKSKLSFDDTYRMVIKDLDKLFT